MFPSNVRKVHGKKLRRKREMRKEKLEEVSCLVQERLGNDHEVCPEIRQKNNSTVRYGIMIKEKEDFIGATIYIDEERMSWEVTEIVEFILNAYDEIGPADDEVREIAESIFDKEELLRNVNYAVINREKNAEMLQHVPHKVFLDLALIYKFYRQTDNGAATFTITNEFLEKTNLEYAELEAAAIVNYLQEQIDFVNMSEFLGPLYGYLGEESPMWVAKAANTGASVIAHPIFFREVAKEWDSDFIVFPSSVYEIILYKINDANDEGEIASLKEMVATINDSEVAEEEILSYNVYRYERSVGRLQLV